MTSPDSSVHWSFSLLAVQEWIGAARRSRDLLAGSRLLSWWVARAVYLRRDTWNGLGPSEARTVLAGKGKRPERVVAHRGPAAEEGRPQPSGSRPGRK